MSVAGEIIFVVGPTAAGKSAWALAEAGRHNGLILNADSVQVYRGMDIGTAKPTAAERAQIRHELFDLVNPDQVFTAGEYRRAALAVIEREAGRHPLYVVGGSGFYIQALEKGMYDVGPVDPEVRDRVEQIESAGQLWPELQKVDPASAARLNPNDKYRLRRALEITLSEGRPWSTIAEEFKDRPGLLTERYQVRKVGFAPDRENLRERIAARTRTMLENGFVDEVKALIKAGYGDSRALASVGYHECVEYLAGRLEHNSLGDAIVTSTMQLAKKQTSWFKRDRDIRWIN